VVGCNDFPTMELTNCESTAATHFPAPKLGQHGNDKMQRGTDQLVVEAIGTQLAYYKKVNPPCRG
jgi:hypothetical protein